MIRSLGLIGLTALGYYLAGRAGLLLAIPPGYATAVWPASGVALAAILLGGTRLWPGVLLGSFLVNVGTSFDASSVAAFARSLAIATTIGAGASLQAVVGAWLIRRLVGYSNILTQEFGAVRLLLLGGPASCLINASVGTGVLWAAGLIPGETYLFNWWTWWVGDSIGVLIFTPLLLVWALRPWAQWRRQRLIVTLPMLAMFGAVVMLFVFVSQREEARIDAEFEKWIGSYTHELEKDVGIYRNMLAALGGFYEGSEQVTAEEFGYFAERLLAYNPEVQALSWNPRVPHAERDAFEAGQRAAGRSDYRIYSVAADGGHVPVPASDEYFPVEFAVPLERNRVTLGFDIGSESLRRQAIRSAMQSGRATATAPINLVQSGARPIGLLIIEPVHTTHDRQSALEGFVVVVIRVADILHSAELQIAGGGLEVRIHDITEAGQVRFVYSNVHGNVTAQGGQDLQEGGLNRSRMMGIAGRQWRLDFRVSPEYLIAHRSWQAWSLLATGLMFTSILGLFLLLSVGYTARIETVVVERTLSLNRANEELERQIAERTRLQREADQRSRLLADKNQELERFAYVVSHDLQAPLRGVSGFASLLEQRYANALDADGREYLQFITQGAGQMHRMIGDILELSRIGTRAISPRPVDVAALVQRVCSTLRMDIEQAGASVEVGPLPTVQADEGQLLLLFQNLIGNALKFRFPARRPVVRISARELGTDWEFRIADNGIGIPKDRQDRLFGLFMRLHTADEYPGTGLGLAICKRIIERHHGRIWLESAPGEGTTFCFTLPSVAQGPGAKASQV